MRRHDRGALRLANRLRLALEPECLENRRPPPERNPGMERTRSETLKLFVVLGIGRRSLLLSSTRSIPWWRSSCQGQTRHLWSPALGQQCSVELLEWTGLGRCDDHRSLKQILQIVIVVLVQAANGHSLLHLLQLPVDMAVIGAAARLDRKTTDTPQLPLGAKTVRCLQNAKRHRRADRADRGNFAEPFPGAVLVAPANNSWRTSWRNVRSASSCWK